MVWEMQSSRGAEAMPGVQQAAAPDSQCSHDGVFSSTLWPMRRSFEKMT